MQELSYYSFNFTASANINERYTCTETENVFLRVQAMRRISGRHVFQSNMCTTHPIQPRTIICNDPSTRNHGYGGAHG